MDIILASNSPRRRELLKEIVASFLVIPAKGEEKVEPSLSCEKVAMSLAEQKCNEVFSNNTNCLVIGCDTIVVLDGEILGKPKDKEDAVNTLKKLSSRTHSVITGVCVQTPEKKITTYAETKVKFFPLTNEFILEYVEGGSPMDKAGSYGIQDGGLVEAYYGSYTNVVGLPVELLKEILTEFLK